MAFARAAPAARPASLARPGGRAATVRVCAKGDGARVDRSKKTDVM